MSECPSISETAFTGAARRNGVELAPASLMLYVRAGPYINGEPCRMEETTAVPLRRLSDKRALPGHRIPGRGLVTNMLYRWYRAGYIYLSKSGSAG